MMREKLGLFGIEEKDKFLILDLEKYVLTFISSWYGEFKSEKASIIHLSILPFCIG